MNVKLESATEEPTAPEPESNSDFGGDTGVRTKLPVASAEGPTYANLTETLLEVQSDPHDPQPVARHVCAVLSAWAHADAETASQVLARLGLVGNRCQRIAIENRALSLSGSVLVVHSKCGRVALVAYQGFDPFALAGWTALGDAQPALLPVPPAGPDARVAAQPYRNMRASWAPLMEALTGKKRKGELEALFLTGHGSGGAAAMLAAYKLVTSQQPDEQRIAERLAQVYTYGAPMFGNLQFARAWNDHHMLHDRVFCHLHGRDPVPCLPPRGTHLLRHVGKHYAVDSGNEPWPKEPGAGPRQMASTFDLLRALVPLLREKAALPTGLDRRWFSAKSLSTVLGLLFADGPNYSIYDHTPLRYLIATQPKGVLGEFGEHF